MYIYLSAAVFIIEVRFARQIFLLLIKKILPILRITDIQERFIRRITMAWRGITLHMFMHMFTKIFLYWDSTAQSIRKYFNIVYFK